MPTMKLRFPGGRYHATPWGHHVNEGLIEWPPSPWRLLRALIACGFSSQGWNEISPTARSMIDKLAAVLPLYRLPSASTAHSRHFMPVGVLTKGREQTTLVFDTWANVGSGELVIHWPCQLDAEEVNLLGKLASSLGYLGRSESWVDAQLTDEAPVEWNAVPCAEQEHRGPGWEQVSLMAAISPDAYMAWQRQQAEAALAPFPLPEGKKKPTAKLLKERGKAVDPYPPDLVSCMTKDTAWWKGHGWSQPPGSQRVLYWRRSDAMDSGLARPRTKRSVRTVTSMLLSISTRSGRSASLPSVERTLPQAELVHRALISRLARGQRIVCPELTGRDTSGKALDGAHGHAHVIPLDLNVDNRIDHVLVWAPEGMGAVAQQAIRDLKRTWTKGVGDELQLALVASGAVDGLRNLPSPFGISIRRMLGESGGSVWWRSATPFVPPRFLKARGRNTLLGQINSELESRNLPVAEDCEIDLHRTILFRKYVRVRNRAQVRPPADSGYALRLRFSRPLAGPLLLGYGSHFGLGRFEEMPLDEDVDVERRSRNDVRSML